MEVEESKSDVQVKWHCCAIFEERPKRKKSFWPKIWFKHKYLGCWLAPINRDFSSTAERLRLMVCRLIADYYGREYHHYWIPLKKFCIGVIGQNAKRTLFLSFLWAAHWKNVRGLRWNNFEATGHTHSSFWPKFTKLLRGSVESGNTSKFVGPRPCQSQKIKILFRWNRCF